MDDASTPPTPPPPGSSSRSSPGSSSRSSPGSSSRSSPGSPSGSSSRSSSGASTAPPPGSPPAPSFWRGQWSVVAVVALGGGLGAAARYGAGLLWPTPAAGFPWTTLLVNVVGCGLIGVLMVLVTEVRAAPTHRLARPFLGTGVLGGFTTFSTYAQDIERHLTEGRALTAVSYLLLTLVGALAAVLGTAAATRRLGRRA